MYSEDELIALSALQHIYFCERQCTLIYVEQVWVENRFTAEGRIMCPFLSPLVQGRGLNPAG